MNTAELTRLEIMHPLETKMLTLKFKKVIYRIQSKRPTYAMRKVAVTVCENERGGEN